MKIHKPLKQKFLYAYVVSAGIFMLLGAISLIFLPIHWSIPFIPVVALVAVFIVYFIIKNLIPMWIFIKDMRKGKLLLYLNRNTHWSMEHKLQVLKWVFPKANQIRKEDRQAITDLVIRDIKPTPEQEKDLKKSVVSCPMQIKMVFNEAMLIQALIFTHINIVPLDQGLRNIMELTEDNINNFDLQREADRCLK